MWSTYDYASTSSRIRLEKKRKKEKIKENNKERNKGMFFSTNSAG